LSMSFPIYLLAVVGALIFIAANSAGISQAQTSAKTIAGEWTAGTDRSNPGEINFTFQYRYEKDGFTMNSRNLPLSQMQGLPATALSGAKMMVNFNIVREAGTFYCEGFFNEGRGAGLWTLKPNEKFISEMRSRGYDNLAENDLLSAAMNELTLKLVDDLKAAGYENLTFQELRRARTHNISADYIKEVRAMGFDRQPLEKIIRLRNHRITAEFIGGMKSAGFENLSIEELIRLRNHKVTPAFVNEIKAEGYSGISVETAVRLRNHNVDAEFIRRAKSQGYQNATLEELIRLRNRGIVK
jgi:hypothetical protein